MSQEVLRSKVLVIGPSTVGKTSLVKTFATDGKQFSQTYSMTLTAEPTIKAVTVEESNITVEFFLYDISGSSIFEYEYPEVFKNANQFALVFDITRGDTFRDCRPWLDKIAKYAGRTLPGVLIGNKSDLSDYADVTDDDCHSFGQEMKVNYFEVSAKTNAGVSAPFVALAEQFIHMYEAETEVFLNAD